MSSNTLIILVVVGVGAFLAYEASRQTAQTAAAADKGGLSFQLGFKKLGF